MIAVKLYFKMKFTTLTEISIRDVKLNNNNLHEYVKLQYVKIYVHINSEQGNK